MESKITATELARTLSDVLNRVRYRGDRFLVERNGEPVASIGPAGPAPGRTLRDVAERLRGLGGPDEAFADDLDAVQEAQPEAGPIPWPS